MRRGAAQSTHKVILGKKIVLGLLLISEDVRDLWDQDSRREAAKEGLVSEE